MARVLAEAGPAGKEEPVATLCLFRQTEQLCQHEHLLGQQHTGECPCQPAWTGLHRLWIVQALVPRKGLEIVCDGGVRVACLLSVTKSDALNLTASAERGLCAI